MSELHPLGVTEESREKIEGVDSRFILDGMLWAREKSWQAFDEIKKNIKVGQTEMEARKMAVGIFADMGSKKHWHQPSIRFGSGTKLTFHKPLRDDYLLQPNDPVFVDLGPVWKDESTGIEYEGDVGDTFVLGSNADAEACVKTIHQLFQSAKERWKSESCSGKALYEQIESQAEAAGYRFIDNVVGHRLGDFPHQRYTKVEMPKLLFHPTAQLWVLELQIAHPELPIGAFYEDLLF